MRSVIGTIESRLSDGWMQTLLLAGVRLAFPFCAARAVVVTV